jgi:glutamate-1-semialdehyde 2,1-aminomutase
MRALSDYGPLRSAFKSKMWVQQAIVAAMGCAPVVPLPHPLEVEVTRILVEDIPCAEMAIFGKNGSDVCTVAARVARVSTGRPVILFSGYHGWQDWWVEQAGFAATGVPERPRPLIHRFRFNDLEDFTRLYAAHRHELAAVMLEPSGPAESVGRPLQDADRDFLAALAAMTREAGALLIFDEIMTGFRYPGGSVQKATGVVPDLACLGKALGGGMPLSAFVGRAHILRRAMEHTHSGPTYRGEVYSLAAARAALEIYRREPVADHVWRFGTQLRQGVNALCAGSPGNSATASRPSGAEPPRSSPKFTGACCDPVCKRWTRAWWRTRRRPSAPPSRRLTLPPIPSSRKPDLLPETSDMFVQTSVLQDG